MRAPLRRLTAAFLLAALVFVHFSTPLALSANPGMAPGNPGESGLSFAYDQTQGQVEAPYLDDPAYLNHPHRVTVDSNGALWVVEREGSRVLKYTATGEHLLTLGKPGMHVVGTDTFLEPQQVTAAPDGQVWVADLTRLVAFDAGGKYIRSVPEPGAADSPFDGVYGIAFDGSDHLFASENGADRVMVYDWVSGSAPVYRTAIGDIPRPKKIHARSDGTLLVVFQDGVKLCQPTTPQAWSCQNAAYQFGSFFWDAAFDPFDPDVLYYLKTEASAVGGPTAIYRCVLPDCVRLATTTYPAHSLALDALGNIYASATANQVVEKYTPSGSRIGIVLGTIDSPIHSDNEHFYQPRLIIDSNGSRYVLERGACRLHKFSSTGAHLWSYGAAGRCNTSVNKFTAPAGMDFDADGNILVADKTQVYAFKPPANQSLFTIQPKQPQPDETLLNAVDVAFDKVDRLVYIVDSHPDRRRVSVMNVFGTLYREKTIGAEPICDLQSTEHLCQPTAVAVDEQGYVYIADADKGAILKYDPQHNFLFQIHGSGHNDVSEISDLAVDKQGRLYAADTRNNRVQVFDSTGAYLATIGGSTGSTPGLFRAVSGVGIDPNGNVYVSDSANASWQVFKPGYPGWEQANVNGFGDQYQTGLRALEEYNGALYAAADGASDGTLWRSTDGKHWTAAAVPSPFHPADLQVFESHLYATSGGRLWKYDEQTWESVFQTTDVDSTLGAMEVFDGELYTAENNASGGLIIHRGRTAGGFRPEVSGGNGSTNNRSVGDFAVFEGNLFASVTNTVDGAEIWQRSPDGTGWERRKLGDVQHTGALAVFQETMYAAANRTAGIQLLRSTDGQNWSEVNNTGLSDPHARSLDVLTVFQNALYAGMSSSSGLSVSITTDGVNWSPLAQDGFGDPSSHALRQEAAAAFNDFLYFGVENPAKGGQVWKLLVQNPPPPPPPPPPPEDEYSFLPCVLR